jgi:hypothetical protein
LALRKFAARVPCAKIYLGHDGKFPFLDENSKKYLKIAKKIRNDETFHYDPKGILDKVNRLNQQEGHFHWKSTSRVNSVSGFHDSALMLSEFSSDDYASLYEFSTWCYHAAGEISAFCETCLEEIVRTNGLENQTETIRLSLGVEFSHAGFRWPLVVLQSD